MLIGLSVFDIIGEYVAQGTLSNTVSVSFLVASILLIMVVIFSRQQPSNSPAVEAGPHASG